MNINKLSRGDAGFYGFIAGYIMGGISMFLAVTSHYESIIKGMLV